LPPHRNPASDLNSRRSIPSNKSSVGREHQNYTILPGVLEPPLSIRPVVRSITFVLTRFPSTTQNSEYITAALFLRRFCQLFLESRLGTRDCGSRQSTNSEILHPLYRFTSVSLRSSGEYDSNVQNCPFHCRSCVSISAFHHQDWNVSHISQHPNLNSAKDNVHDMRM
jgi:hypothetical protein